jgi:hypothetical protein
MLAKPCPCLKIESFDFQTPVHEKLKSFTISGRFPIVGDGKENRCSQQSQHCGDDFEFQCGQGFIDAPICIPYNLTCDGVAHCPGNSYQGRKIEMKDQIIFLS